MFPIKLDDDELKQAIQAMFDKMMSMDIENITAEYGYREIEDGDCLRAELNGHVRFIVYAVEKKP